MNISKLRKEIDRLDEKLITLLNQRTQLAVDIGKFKKDLNQSVYTPAREQQIYLKLKKINKGPLSVSALMDIYREIMSAAIMLQKPMKVAYLGPQATFTHLGALKKFGSQIEYISADTISDVFSEVERGRCDYGVVPVENSLEGAVNHTLDMLVDSDLKIYSEILLNISHNLLANCAIGEIKKVYSHPQVFGQCRLWLKNNLSKREFIEVSSTTKAAEMAAKQKNSAAIASNLAAQIYQIKILAQAIEDSPHNVTRFLVISKNTAEASGGDKTSIVFSVKDKVGALQDILLIFKSSDINLTKIESRPSKRKVWDYYFFVDMQGHISNPQISKAISSLDKKCRFLKILGSYPQTV
ncbi:MAG: prephenate dehydratase [Candidatus Omnitrophota bacterium]|nr:MAG: prephenate dehydratase [Candidatus Omnitrophota bacterium]